MRGTLHFVAATDIHWMRALLTPKILTNSAKRHAELGLMPAVLAKCEKIFIKALRGRKQLTREKLSALLERERIPASGPRRYHIFWRLAQEGLLCFGTHERKQPTFALLDEWVPATRALDREESLAELARRYFTSHGPATLQDFIWWSGLKTSDARTGIALAGPSLLRETVDDIVYWMGTELPDASIEPEAVYLLPGFDEYLLGYTDRSAMLDRKHADRICPGFNGVFFHTVVCHGRVKGTWKRVVKKDAVTIAATPFKTFSRAEKTEIAAAAKRYGNYLGVKAGTSAGPASLSKKR
jgi:hypothetical protein